MLSFASSAELRRVAPLLAEKAFVRKPIKAAALAEAVRRAAAAPLQPPTAARRSSAAEAEAVARAGEAADAEWRAQRAHKAAAAMLASVSTAQQNLQQQINPQQQPAVASDSVMSDGGESWGAEASVSLVSQQTPQPSARAVETADISLRASLSAAKPPLSPGGGAAASQQPALTPVPPPGLPPTASGGGFFNRGSSSDGATVFARAAKEAALAGPEVLSSLSILIVDGAMMLLPRRSSLILSCCLCFVTACRRRCLLRSHPVSRLAPAPPAAPPPDNATNLKVAAAVLRRCGYAAVDTAMNGEQAFNAVVARNGDGPLPEEGGGAGADAGDGEPAVMQPPFSVVFMDLQMPVMNGALCLSCGRRNFLPAACRAGKGPAGVSAGCPGA